MIDARHDVVGAHRRGLGFGIYLAVDTALMTEVLPREEDRAKDMGILDVSNSAGQILASGPASLVVGVAGYRPLFVVGLVVSIASRSASGHFGASADASRQEYPRSPGSGAGRDGEGRGGAAGRTAV